MPFAEFEALRFKLPIDGRTGWHRCGFRFGMTAADREAIGGDAGVRSAAEEFKRDLIRDLKKVKGIEIDHATLSWRENKHGTSSVVEIDVQVALP